MPVDISWCAHIATLSPVTLIKNESKVGTYWGTIVDSLGVKLLNNSGGHLSRAQIFRLERVHCIQGWVGPHFAAQSSTRESLASTRTTTRLAFFSSQVKTCKAEMCSCKGHAIRYSDHRPSGLRTLAHFEEGSL